MTRPADAFGWWCLGVLSLAAVLVIGMVLR
jgi:hypothetical protein